MASSTYRSLQRQAELERARKRRREDQEKQRRQRTSEEARDRARRNNDRVALAELRHQQELQKVQAKLAADERRRELHREEDAERRRRAQVDRETAQRKAGEEREAVARVVADAEAREAELEGIAAGSPSFAETGTLLREELKHRAWVDPDPTSEEDFAAYPFAAKAPDKPNVLPVQALRDEARQHFLARVEPFRSPRLATALKGVGFGVIVVSVLACITGPFAVGILGVGIIVWIVGASVAGRHMKAWQAANKPTWDELLAEYRPRVMSVRESARAAHEEEERQRVEYWRQILAGDPALTEDYLGDALPPEGLPVDVTVRTRVPSAGRVEVAFVAPPASVLPPDTVSADPSGRMLVTRPKKADALAAEHRAVVCGLALRIAAEVIVDLPAIQVVVLDGYERRIHPDDGHAHLDCVFTATFMRASLSTLNLANVEPEAAAKSLGARVASVASGLSMQTPTTSTSPQDDRA